MGIKQDCPNILLNIHFHKKCCLLLHAIHLFLKFFCKFVSLTITIKSMKKILILMVGILISVQTYSQWNWPIITFDDSTYLNYIIIDTISNTNNIWQVGAPDKINFTQAYSQPNAMVTDTNQPYPANDTSIFYIRYVTPENIWGSGWVQTALVFRYKIDTDEDFDFGKIEFSPDNGQLWIDYSNDTIYNNCYYLTSDPVFTGTSVSWSQFGVYNEPYSFNINDGDTVWYRFTFISDGIQNQNDGWMIDDIYLEDIYEGVEESINRTISLNIYPNPVKNQSVFILFENITCFDNIELMCYNVYGLMMYKERVDRHQSESRVSTEGWPPGIYMAIISSNGTAIGKRKFVVE
ncbi:MAG: hypothetical protein B6I19_08455 [Bacteroidetes bacterium 4572_114]|nr:MAG: hypothetical protein B6I19_08455 [Bacteroidetes bacterium 4572_114]